MNRSFEVKITTTRYNNGREYWVITFERSGYPVRTEEYLKASWTPEQATMDVLTKARLVEPIR